MMIKKAFTLIELVIVILIIWILFGALGYLSWSYVYKLNLQNDQETISQTFFSVQTMSLSQPVYKNIPLSYIWVKLIPEKSYFLVVGLTGSLSKDVFSLDSKHLNYLKFGSGFNVSGDFYAGEGIFLYKPYKIGAYFLIDNKIFSWNTIVKFTFSDKNNKVCFKMNLASGRLNKIKCK